MSALGGGAEDEALSPQVDRADNYHVDYVTAAPGHGASLHSHDSEESFISLKGRWRIAWGTHGEDELWSIVAAVRRLPELDAAAYRAATRSGPDGTGEHDHSQHRH